MATGMGNTRATGMDRDKATKNYKEGEDHNEILSQRGPSQVSCAVYYYVRNTTVL